MMKLITLFLQIIYIFFIMTFTNSVLSEPFVVLQYRGDTQINNEQSDNVFLKDNNHNTQHTVLKNETLSDIMLKYYGFKSFNKRILSLAIVHFNQHAFVRSNPNFLFSKKKLYLPSINEIKNLIINKPKLNDEAEINQGNSSQIYFFGG